MRHKWKPYPIDEKVADLFDKYRFELIDIRFEDDQIWRGWWTGMKWDGLRRRPDLKMIEWKRIT